MIPHLLKKEKIPAITNTNLIHAIEHVRESKDKSEALARAYQCITDRFHGYRFHTYLLFHKAFKRNPNTLWEQRGFMHCTQQNYLLRLLLVESGWFTEDDITLGHSLVWHISPHQYLMVQVDGKKIAVDPWNNRHGAKMGTFASGFGFKEVQ